MKCYHHFDIKSYWILIIAALHASLAMPAFGADVYVSNPGELATAATTVNPGDRIILNDGVYTDVHIYFYRGGVAGSPVTIQAANPGGAVFQGETGFVIGVPYMTFKDLFITDGEIFQTKASIFTIYSHHINIENVKITEMGNGSLTSGSWIKSSIESYACTVKNCYFERDDSPGVLIFFNISQSPDGMSHQITGNYFKRDKVTTTNNGNETIRLGSGSSIKYGDGLAAGYYGDNIISGNLFLECDGEAEIISLKSSNNTIINNTFRNCKGAVMLRMYGDNTVTENFFFGGDDSEECSTVTVYGGTDHKITYNTFYYCTPGAQNGSGVISVACGTGVDNQATFQQPQNVQISNNTIYYTLGVGTGIGLTRAYYPQDGRDLLPINTMVFDNIIHNTGTANAFNNWQNATVYFDNNYAYSQTGLPANTDGVTCINVCKVRDEDNENMWRPCNLSFGVPKPLAIKTLDSSDIAQAWMK